MEVIPQPKPFGIVCHKGMKFGGVITPNVPEDELSKFLLEFALNGYSIVPVYSLKEYLDLLEGFEKVAEEIT